MKIGLLLAVPLWLFLGGCATLETSSVEQQRERLENKWVGKKIDEAVAKFGPPVKTIDDGKGGQLYVFRYVRESSIPGVDARTTYLVTFFVDESGTVYRIGIAEP